MSWAEDAGAAPAMIDMGATPTANRFVAFSGVPPAAALCTTGQDADAVSPAQGNGANQEQGYLAVPGLPLQVESGAAFSSGATLQSDSVGRAITRTSGVAIARALQAATAAGQITWVVILSGR